MTLRKSNEFYISVDIETDGPIPGPHSMLSIGAAAYDASGERVSTFTANLDALPGAAAHPETMAWWATEPEAWKECRKNPVPPKEAMETFQSWIEGLGGKPVFVAYPAGFDFTFVYWYLIHFTGNSPFSHSALDMKTLAMALMQTPYRESVKRNMPKRWFSSTARHTHTALEDAIEQGELFCAMLRDLRESPATNPAKR